MKNKRTSVSYSTSYRSYYTFGSVHLASLAASSIKDLKSQMLALADKCKESRDVEVITFEPINKTVVIKASKGKFVKFRRITNNYLYGVEKPDKKFFDELKIV